ncbi:ABC transporter domain-containing protein [Microthyrium microscopicum]|uniref:ABC transporter domain-containing protein n=1 Tax=Microthyrium microscopicum TaxID=703497 RepID=A0A6A6UJA4_9PEZI|nr:ABC transporter domain-containing protein [Microthyrium microscopicum]
MELQLRQLGALIEKDLRLLFTKKSSFFTIVRAFWIPIIIALYLTVIFKIYWPGAVYGIGSPVPIRSLLDGMNAAHPGLLILVNNASSSGGDIDQVIKTVAEPIQAAGKQLIITNNAEDLHSLCRPSLSGATNCFGAAVFQSSPSEGTGGIWNYTLRGDASLGLNNLDVTKNTNDAQLYTMPLQHAIDSAISYLDSGNGTSALPSRIDDFLFTSKTEDQWKDSMRITLLQANINFASVVWVVAMIGVTFQLVTLMAKERETEMSDLIESMMPNTRRWEPQAIRLLAHHLAFDIVYLPSWIFVGIFLKAGYYKASSGAIPVIGIILAGLAFVSFSLLGAAFFKRAQLSSVSIVGIFVVLAVVAQVTSKNMSTVGVAITGLLFAPMAFVNMLIIQARYEHEQQSISMIKAAPTSPWSVPVLAFWIFFVIQIFVYPLLAALVERWLYGTAASRTDRSTSTQDDDIPVRVENVSKTYQHSWLWNKILGLFGKSTKSVHAVKNISLSALKGQVMVLVGANGCGKSTILNAIVGLGSTTSGTIHVNGSGGIGICPQKNVLFSALSVQAHAKIFNRLKAAHKTQVGADLDQLYQSCGLVEKKKMPSKSLSGGQKRKLQLLMMLTGGSNVCCVDEASGGLDPLSRRKIWDVLLAERGSRTVLLTTHFLDEAEFLADQMVIMHKGEIKSQGSVSELKSKLNNGYRVQVIRSEKTGHGQPEQFEHSENFSTAGLALARVRELEAEGTTNYQISGPTIEDVFMDLAADEDAAYEEDGAHVLRPAASPRPTSDLSDNKEGYTASAKDVTGETKSRKAVGVFKQAQILFVKRWTVFQRNPAPLLQALLIPIVAAGLLSILIKGIRNPGCDLGSQFSTQDTTTLSSKNTPQLLIGPSNALNAKNIGLITRILPSGTFGQGGGTTTSVINFVHSVNSFSEFNDWTKSNYTSINPGGVYLGDSSTPPTFNIRSNIGSLAIFSGVLLQSILNSVLVGTSIAAQYTTFDIAFPDGTTDTLQFTFYFGLIMGSVPAFFTLYVCQERLRGVKAMEFSNGVRPLPLWAAYTLFDWIVTIISAVFVTVIYAAATGSTWYGIGYFFLVLVLYGLAAVLLSYIIARYSKSSFAAFAFSAGGQCVMLLIYLTSYLTLEARASPVTVARSQNIAYYVIGSISPITQLIKAMLVALNLFSILCKGQPPAKATNPGSWELYGAPIFFLIIQSLIMFAFIIWSDHGYSLRGLGKSRSLPSRDPEHIRTVEPEVLAEEKRVETSTDGLKVQHIDKIYKSIGTPAVHAVDDLSFGVQRGEVFALVGPNGAGKSSTISMLRGETKPTGSKGDLFVQDVSVLKDKYLARFHLGVCPQFDAMDKLTVREHLAFYAKIRGCHGVDAIVEQMIRSVGLQPFADRMAEKLSGGNKRKLSLAMALIGNPEVVLLDEPSSGMDPLAKRNMWKTLSAFKSGRSILLTTHSMEEADALATRVAIIAGRLLDIGTTDHLRKKHGSGFHLHLVQKTAPNTSVEEMEKLQHWIEEKIPGSKLEGFPYHGQMRFLVPLKSNTSSEDISPEEQRSVASLFSILEESKDMLGVEFYSVSPSAFDEIFLTIVKNHNIGEEDNTRASNSAGIRKLFSCLPVARLFRRR